MFERMMTRAQAAAAERARRRSIEVAERLRPELPSGVEAEAEDRGVLMSGRGLRRRFALDPALRWLIGAMR